MPLTTLPRVGKSLFGTFDPNGRVLHFYIRVSAGSIILQCTRLLLIFCFVTCQVAILVIVFLCLLSSKEKMSSYFEEKAPCCGSHFWILLSTCWGFVLFAAITSGLALGLLSFSQVDLEVLVKAGKPQIQKNAGTSLLFVGNFLHLRVP